MYCTPLIHSGISRCLVVIRLLLQAVEIIITPGNNSLWIVHIGSVFRYFLPLAIRIEVIFIPANLIARAVLPSYIGQTIEGIIYIGDAITIGMAEPLQRAIGIVATGKRLRRGLAVTFFYCYRIHASQTIIAVGYLTVAAVQRRLYQDFSTGDGLI